MSILAVFAHFRPISGHFSALATTHFVLIGLPFNWDGGGRGIENDSRKICFLAFLLDKLTNMYIVVIFIFLLSTQSEAI